MRLVVCLDDADGILFRGRRQSKDSLLRDRLLQLTEGSVLWMNEYSSRQFTHISENFRISESFLEDAGSDDYCFLENGDIQPHMHKVQQLIVYRWNELYPSDVKFPMDQFVTAMKKQSVFSFLGSSHGEISEEIYEKET